MNPDQVKGALDRAMTVLVTMALGWLVKKGYLGESDAATLTPAIVLLPAIAYGWWNNRDKALLQSAANVTGPDGRKTLIVAPKELAEATPENNIVSNEKVDVVNK